MTLFRLPGLFLAWEVIGGANPSALVDEAAAAGFKWIVQEYGDPRTQPTDAAIALLRARCHARGVYYGGWSQRVNVDLAVAARPNLWIFNVESDGSDYTADLARFRHAYPRLPAGVVTDCGIDPPPFIKHDVKCLPEAYAGAPGQNPVSTPANMVARAHELGWTYAFPVLGVFDGGPLAGYTRAGDGYSVYLAAGMDEADWATAKAWNA